MPKIVDPEFQLVSLIAVEKDKATLPSFITFDLPKMTIHPTSNDIERTYVIQIRLIDDFGMQKS